MKPGSIYEYSKVCPNCHSNNFYMHIDEVDHLSGVVQFHSACHTCSYLNVNQAGLLRTLYGWISAGSIVNVKQPECTCGGKKCNTTHSRWCEAYVS